MMLLQSHAFQTTNLALRWLVVLMLSMVLYAVAVTATNMWQQ